MNDKRTFAEGQRKLSKAAKKTGPEGPRNGGEAANIVATKDSERGSERKGNLAEFFSASPLRGSGIKIKRIKGKLRPVEL